MKALVVGKERASFKTKDGKVIKYARLYINTPPLIKEDSEFVGLDVGMIKLPYSLYDSIELDTWLNIEFDYQGRLREVTKL